MRERSKEEGRGEEEEARRVRKVKELVTNQR